MFTNTGAKVQHISIFTTLFWRILLLLLNFAHFISTFAKKIIFYENKFA
jgi:hypothetical protein